MLFWWNGLTPTVLLNCKSPDTYMPGHMHIASRRSGVALAGLHMSCVILSVITIACTVSASGIAGYPYPWHKHCMTYCDVCWLHLCILMSVDQTERAHRLLLQIYQPYLLTLVRPRCRITQVALCINTDPRSMFFGSVRFGTKIFNRFSSNSRSHDYYIHRICWLSAGS